MTYLTDVDLRKISTTMDILKLGLSSPVLIALIYGLVAVIGGRIILGIKDQELRSLERAHRAVLEAKDDQLRAKQGQIDLVERLSPARVVEYLGDYRKSFEILLEKRQAELDDASERIGHLETVNQLTTSEQAALLEERHRLETEVNALHSQADAAREAVEAASKIGSRGLVPATPTELMLRVRAVSANCIVDELVSISRAGQPIGTLVPVNFWSGEKNLCVGVFFSAVSAAFEMEDVQYLSSVFRNYRGTMEATSSKLILVLRAGISEKITPRDMVHIYDLYEQTVDVDSLIRSVEQALVSFTWMAKNE